MLVLEGYLIKLFLNFIFILIRVRVRVNNLVHESRLNSFLSFKQLDSAVGGKIHYVRWYMS